MANASVEFDLHRFAEIGAPALKMRGNLRTLAQHPRNWRIRVEVEGDENEDGVCMRDSYCFHNRREKLMLSDLPEFVWARVCADWEGLNASVNVYAEILR